MWVLRFLTGPSAGKTIPLSKSSTLIGRAPSCDIKIASPSVSKEHTNIEIIEDRYDKGSLIITSQVPVDRWHDMIGIPTLADAILDRVVHNAHRIELKGESLRKPSAG